MSKTILANYLQNQIRTRMKEKNLGPTELDKRAGLNRGTSSNILRGSSKNPTLETISSIAKTLNCTIDELITDPEITIIKSHQPKNIQYELSFDLFSQVVSYSLSCLKNPKQNIQLDTFLNILREGYIYSLLKNNKSLDKNFIEWMVDKSNNSF